jgi:hypothetical protein
MREHGRSKERSSYLYRVLFTATQPPPGLAFPGRAWPQHVLGTFPRGPVLR